MAIYPPLIVPAPEPRGRRYGLLTAATGPLDLPEPAGHGGGIQYEPVSCGVAHLFPVECPPDVEPPEKQFDPADPFVEALPFVVYATYECGAAGHQPADLERKVRRRLANGEQTQAEAGLVTPLAAAATALTPPDVGDITAVVGELEEWLYGSAGAGYGNVGYLHASPRVAAYAAERRLIKPEPPLLRSPGGSIWVFGGGYPDGIVFASGQVTVWRAGDVLVPPVEELLDRTTNEYRVIAEREYAAAFDCVSASAMFTPPQEGS